MFRAFLLGFCAVVLFSSCEKKKNPPFDFYVEAQDTFKIKRLTITDVPVRVWISQGQTQEVSLALVNLPPNVKVARLTVLPDAVDTFKFDVYQTDPGTYPIKISAHSAATGTVLYDKWLIIN